MNRLELQRHAVSQYLKAGLSVVPLIHKGKLVDAQALRATGDISIRGNPTWSRYQNELAGEREADIWFGSQLRNIAVLGTKSLMIFDFDSPGVFEAWAEHYPEIAKKTAVQKTRRGYHLFFKIKRGISTPFYTKFSLVDVDGPTVGHVMGKGSYVVVWPSIHPKGYEYRWLDGNAPWESGIMEIGRSAEVGLEIVKYQIRPLRFLTLLLTDPLNSKDMINRKLTRFFGEVTNENKRALFKKGPRSSEMPTERTASGGESGGVEGK